MSSEEEDLLDDYDFKDGGELEDLDDDAENALLGDSDEEGSSRVRDRIPSLTLNSRNQKQTYSGREEDETEEEEEEFEYVDEDGNPVEIGANDDVEYVEVSQEDADQAGLEESANEYVLDLVVDADLEFDDSGVQDTGDELLPASMGNIKQIKPAKQSLPSLAQEQQPKEQNSWNPQQKKIDRAKLKSHKQQNRRLQQQGNQRLQQKRQDQQQQEQERRREQQQLQQQKKQEQREQIRLQEQTALMQHKQFISTRSSSSENEKSVADEVHSFKQEEGYDSAGDNHEQDYNKSLKNESSESEDEEESGRGRFRTERSNVISVSTAKKRPNIPDSLDAVITHEEAARLERSNRQQSKRPWQRGGRDSSRESDRDRNRDKGRNRAHDRNYKDASSIPRHQELGHGNSSHFTSQSDSGPTSSIDSDSPTTSELKSSRKILINPHFKGSIVPSSEVLTQPRHHWENQPTTSSNPGPGDHSSVTNDFHYVSHQPTPEDHYGSAFGTQATSNPLNQPSIPQNPIGQFHFNQPPPAKHTTPFHVPPPNMADFQTRPPPLMSIPPLVPPTNISTPVNLYHPPREQPMPHMAFPESKSHDMHHAQFQSGNDSWAHSADQHTFKPFNVPPPNPGFPPMPQNAAQPPSYPNVQQPPPPIQRTEFQHQLAPPAGPPPTFNRPPPGFESSMQLGGPPPARPLLPTWPAQQQQQRPHPPLPMPVFNRPPPPVGPGGHQNNFQITSLQTSTPLFRLVQPVMTKNLGNHGQFSQSGIPLGQPFAATGQNPNLRSLPPQQQHQTWTKSNLRPIAQQKQPLFVKRLSNEAISASPLKQVKITNLPLPMNRRTPQVNTNIKHVQLVNTLPDEGPLTQGPSGTRNSQPASNIAQVQQVTSNTLNTSVGKANPEASEEDEETRRYRQQIELQKKKREEILRLKEQRRVIMAQQRRKQMLQQQQQPETQNTTAMPGPNIKVLPSFIEIASAKPSSTSSVTTTASSPDGATNSSDNSSSTPESAATSKKRVVVVRRVVSRPFGNVRRQVGQPIRTVTNSGSLLGPVPFSPHFQQEQKGIHRLPSQLLLQDAIPISPKHVVDQHWRHVDMFSNNSNLTNITLQRPNLAEPQKSTAKPLMQNAQVFLQSPRSALQPLQQAGRSIHQQGKPFQQSGRPVQQQGKPFQSPGRPIEHQQKQFQRPGNPQQQSGKQFQPFGRSQQQTNGPLQQSGRVTPSQPSNVISKPVTKGQQAGLNRQRQMMTTEVGVVNLSPDVKLRVNTESSNAAVITINKRPLPAGSGHPLPKRTLVHASETPLSSGPVQHIAGVQQQTQQQVFPANNTSLVQIENLAQATSDVQLRKLCQSIGPVESINLFKDQRRALVKFKNVHHAKQFMDKFQRRMVDLSLIVISLVS